MASFCHRKGERLPKIGGTGSGQTTKKHLLHREVPITPQQMPKQRPPCLQPAECNGDVAVAGERDTVSEAGKVTSYKYICMPIWQVMGLFKSATAHSSNTARGCCRRRKQSEVPFLGGNSPLTKTKVFPTSPVYLAVFPNKVAKPETVPQITPTVNAGGLRPSPCRKHRVLQLHDSETACLAMWGRRSLLLEEEHSPPCTDDIQSSQRPMLKLTVT